MKTREQLIEEVNKKLDSYSPRETVIEIIDLVVEACEEAILTTDEGYRSENLGDIVQIDKTLENLKKLKFK